MQTSIILSFKEFTSFSLYSVRKRPYNHIENEYNIDIKPQFTSICKFASSHKFLLTLFDTTTPQFKSIDKNSIDLSNVTTKCYPITYVKKKHARLKIRVSRYFLTNKKVCEVNYISHLYTQKALCQIVRLCRERTAPKVM